MSDGAGDFGAFSGASPRTPASKQVRLPEPEGVVLIWAWIKRRRAAKRAKLLPTTEGPNPAPPGATP